MSRPPYALLAAHCTHDAFGNDRYPYYVRIGMTDVWNATVQRKVAVRLGPGRGGCLLSVPCTGGKKGPAVRG